MSLARTVILSARSQDLLKRYGDLSVNKNEQLLRTSVDFDQLIQWLCADLKKAIAVEVTKQPEIEFSCVALRVALLHDLLMTFDLDKDTAVEKKEQGAARAKKIKLIALASAGTLLAACQGFDGITSVLSVFTSASLGTLGVGLAFSVLSIVVFYGYNVTEISNSLGIKWVDAPKLLDLYLQQMHLIKSLRKKINKCNLAELSSDELIYLAKIIELLQQQRNDLVAVSQQFDSALKSKKMQGIKYAFTGMAAAIFFGSGFFAGHSVAVFVLGLFLTNVSLAFWPVILFSLAVGLAALSLYWYVDRTEVEQLVSSWFGLDESKIEKLCDAEKLSTEVEQLDNLKEKIRGTALLIHRVEVLQGQSADYHEKNNYEIGAHTTAPSTLSRSQFSLFRLTNKTKEEYIRSNMQDVFDEGYGNFTVGL